MYRIVASLAKGASTRTRERKMLKINKPNTDIVSERSFPYKRIEWKRINY